MAMKDKVEKISVRDIIEKLNKRVDKMSNPNYEMDYDDAWHLLDYIKDILPLLTKYIPEIEELYIHSLI